MSYVTEGNKIRALYDIKVFADLIEFKGGWKSFGTLHKKLVGFVTSPQTVRLKKGKVRLSYLNRRLLLVPRGHLKSTVSSILYVLWRIYRNPNIRILVGTNLKTLAQSFIRELRQYLENPELQEKVWNARPHIQGRLIPVMDAAGRKRRSQKSAEVEETDTEDKKLIWTIDALQVLRTETLKEPTVLATSLGTRVTGQHYDLLILDDVVDFDNSSNDDKRTKVIEWAGDMESVLDPVREVYCGEHKKLNGASISRVEKQELIEAIGDEVVMLGTRYEDGDLYDYTMENMKEFEYRVFTRNIHRNGQNWVKPTNTEEEYKEERRNYKLGDASGGYIWSEKFNDDAVRRLKARLTPRRWASQYLNTILNVGESILDAEKIRYFRSALTKAENNLVKVTMPGEDAVRLIRPILAVDLAVSQKSTADNTAMVVGGQDEDGNLIVVDAKVSRLTIDKQVEQFFELCEKWNITKAVIETVGYQGAFVQLLKSEFASRKPVFIVEFRPQGEKKSRLETGLQPYFANGKLFLPDWMATHTIIQDEILLFPRDGAHDDFLDALDTIRQHSQKIPRDSRKLLPMKAAVNKKWGGLR